MKFSLSLIILFASATLIKHAPLPQGAVYGSRPNQKGITNAWQLEEVMGNRTRISATIKGKVLKVVKPKGGWINIDAGHGKVITAHFIRYDINVPADLQGKMVIVEGVAQKKFIADDLQTFAGDTANGKKQHNVKTNPKKRLDFEITGLMVTK